MELLKVSASDAKKIRGLVPQGKLKDVAANNDTQDFSDVSSDEGILLYSEVEGSNMELYVVVTKKKRSEGLKFMAIVDGKPKYLVKTGDIEGLYEELDTPGGQFAEGQVYKVKAHKKEANTMFDNETVKAAYSTNPRAYENWVKLKASAKTELHMLGFADV